MRTLSWRLAVATALLLPAVVAAQDWPQILGPGRNGIYTGPPIVPSFPRSGPPLLWKRDVGAGFAGPAVAAGKLVLFHRINNRETVEAMDAAPARRCGRSTISPAIATTSALTKGRAPSR